MHIICLTPLEDGVYNDHKSDIITAPPEGWAMIPEGFPMPSTFPRLGSIEAEDIAYPYEVELEDGKIEQRERIIMTVTAMTEGTLPEVEPIAEQPTQLDVIEAQVVYTAMMTDTLLEV
jgi:hypothetical protein